MKRGAIQLASTMSRSISLPPEECFHQLLVKGLASPRGLEEILFLEGVELGILSGGYGCRSLDILEKGYLPEKISRHQGIDMARPPIFRLEHIEHSFFENVELVSHIPLTNDESACGMSFDSHLPCHFRQHPSGVVGKHRAFPQKVTYLQRLPYGRIRYDAAIHHVDDAIGDIQYPVIVSHQDDRRHPLSYKLLE